MPLKEGTCDRHWLQQGNPKLRSHWYGFSEERIENTPTKERN